MDIIKKTIIITSAILAILGILLATMQELQAPDNTVSVPTSITVK